MMKVRVLIAIGWGVLWPSAAAWTQARPYAQDAVLPESSAAGAGSLLQTWSSNPAALTPMATRREQIRQRLARSFPNVKVKAQDGRELRFYDDVIKNRIVLLNFMFTSCKDLCPRATERLKKVKALLGDRVGKDVFLVSITVDPAVDTPERLERYAQEHHTGPGWTFLTGSEEDLRSIRERLGFRSEDKMDHAGIITFGNEATGTWASIPALVEPQQIVQTFQRIADRRPPLPEPPQLGVQELTP